MKRFTSSLVGRVTAAGALAAALGGAGAALFAGVAAYRLGADLETSNLRRASLALAHELAEELSDLNDTDGGTDESGHSLAESLEDELDDLKLEGVRGSLWLDGRFSAGSPDVAALAANDCEEVTVAGNAVRACTMRVGKTGRVTLATTTRAEQARTVILARALAIGCVGGALLGGLVSYLLARWALTPMDRLRDAVRRVSADDPRTDSLQVVAAEHEVEELRITLANLVERLSSALSRAQAFAAEAAHELRTPLTTIAGELELLVESEPAPGSAALLRVHAQVNELTTLVQRLLALAHPLPLDLDSSETVDLSDVLAAVEQALSNDARSRVHAICQDDVLIRGDGALLRSLLSNAIDNALKFSDGAVDVNIFVRENEACIDITDSGPGVSPRERERVFAPFYRSPSARAAGKRGHGLGLALIATVARRHHGVAELIERSAGAHLRIRLPVLPVPGGGATNC